MRIGILGCAEIASRRFMPAALQVDGFEVVAVAEEFDKDRLVSFNENYGIEIFDGFEAIVECSDIDAVYIPQPPALHYKWAKNALLNGKHVLVEKPSTTCYDNSHELVKIARDRGLAIYENYMFLCHSQIAGIGRLINDGRIGNIRLYTARFGFPLRKSGDFRYSKELGGGALLDAGGYPVRLATEFLGERCNIATSNLAYVEGYEVDMYGNATLTNENGDVFQISFGMDCGYQCSLEVWGSKGRLYTNRVFTAPVGYEPTVDIETSKGIEHIELAADDSFRNSIYRFITCTSDESVRNTEYDCIVRQSRLVDDIRNRG